MRFRGKVSKDGNVLLPAVAGNYDVKTAGGIVSWSGSFSLPPGQFLGIGDFTLELDDSRTGAILVLSVSSGSSQPAVVSFKGNGPPP